MEKIDFNLDRQRIHNDFEIVVAGILKKVDMNKIKEDLIRALDNNSANFRYILDAPEYLSYNPQETETFKKFRSDFLTASGGTCTDLSIRGWTTLQGDGYELNFRVKQEKGFFQRLFN